MPDAHRPAGRYRIATDGSIKVTMRLFHGGRRVLDRVVVGCADNVDGLAGLISDWVAKSLCGTCGPSR